MAEQLGQWANAPLGYVLAAINTSVSLPNAQQAQAIHRALGDRFPELQQGFEAALLPLGAPGGAPQLQSAQYWELVSETQGVGVLFKPSLVVLHATEYVDYPHFRETLHAVLTAFAANGSAAVAVRVGLRYLDFIIPGEGESPDDYVAPSMIGPRLEQFEGVSTHCRAQIVRRISAQSALRVTYTRQATQRGQIPLPEDANLHSLLPSPILLRCQDHEGEIGCIDTDRWEQFREKFSVDALLARFDRLHADQSKAIRIVANDNAMAKWGAKNAA